MLVHRLNPVSAVLWRNTSLEAIEKFVGGFFFVNWTSEAIHDLEDTILSGPVGTYCASVGTGVSATISEHQSYLSRAHAQGAK